MSANSKIEWTDHTFNPWIGCTKVSPACDHCYAEVSTPSRTLGVTWGAGQQRRRTSVANWAMPLRWNAQAEAFRAQHGRRQRVFCASLADVFDKEVDPAWRVDLFRLIEATPNLDWLLLTKRIGNARSLSQIAMGMIGCIHKELPQNLWLGATICNQEEADRDIPKLLAVPAARRFLSIEPLLEPVDLALCDCDKGSRPGPGGAGGITCSRCNGAGGRMVDWVIVGGESGHHARPMNPDWARSLRDQCATAGVPFLFKQWGEWGEAGAIEDHGQAPNGWWEADPADGGRPRHEFPGPVRQGVELASLRPEVFRVGKKAAGRLLDGVQHDGYPA